MKKYLFHGTRVPLACLAKTGHQLLPLSELIKRHLAPPYSTGELTERGAGLMTNHAKSDVCFSDKLETAMSYRDIGSRRKAAIEPEKLTSFIEKNKDYNYVRIQEIILHLIQLRQQGTDYLSLTYIERDDKDNFLTSLAEDIELTIKYYYFILCVMKYITLYCHPDQVPERITDSANMQHSVSDLLSDFLNQATIKRKLKNSVLNMEKLYTQTDEITDTDALELLKILEISTADNIAHTQFFSVSKNKAYALPKSDCYASYFHQDINGLLICQENHQIDFFLRQMIRYSTVNNEPNKYMPGHKPDEDYPVLGEILFTETLTKFNEGDEIHFTGASARIKKDEDAILKMARLLTDQKKLLLDLLSLDQSSFNLDVSRTEQFPLIFGSCIDQSNFYTVSNDECRASIPLTLGKELTLIAADPKNIFKVNKYLQQQNISNVEVVSFSALQANIYTQEDEIQHEVNKCLADLITCTVKKFGLFSQPTLPLSEHTASSSSLAQNIP